MKERINFAWPSTSIARDDYEAFCEWYDQNEELLHQVQLAIWGAGIRGTIFSNLLKRKGYSNIVFVDGNSEKWGGYINEFVILSPDEFEKQRTTCERIILISTENSTEIEKELEEKNYRSGKDFFTINTRMYDKYVEEFKRSYQTKALVMGDCEFSTMAVKDNDYRTLAELLSEKCGREEIKILAMHGMGLRAYYNIFRAQIERGMKPELLLVMVNFDTLTGIQHLLPRSQHAELIQRIYDESDKKNEEFAEYTELVWERSKRIQAEFFTKKDESKDSIVTDAKAKNYFRLNYMYRLNVETEGIVYLGKILEFALEEGVKVVPFIPPVNYQLGENLFGEKFRHSYEKNVETVRNFVEEIGFDLLDLSFLLTAEEFADKRTPDETANEKGRMKVASFMEERIKRELGMGGQ